MNVMEGAYRGVVVDIVLHAVKGRGIVQYAVILITMKRRKNKEGVPQQALMAVEISDEAANSMNTMRENGAYAIEIIAEYAGNAKYDNWSYHGRYLAHQSMF